MLYYFNLQRKHYLTIMHYTPKNFSEQLERNIVLALRHGDYILDKHLLRTVNRKKLRME